MKFVFNLTVREIRASWRRLLFFFLCIGIGVGSIVALRSVIGNVNRAVAGEARNILTADVVVDTSRPWTSEQLAAINRAAQNSNVTGRTETIDSATMTRPANVNGSADDNGGVMMIELKGIEENFPLVGTWQLADGKTYNNELLRNNGAIVSRVLLERLKLNVGDSILIGTEDFQIRAVLESEPGGNAGFGLGPRVFVEHAAIERAGLTGFGSRARRRILFTTTEGNALALQQKLKTELGDRIVNVRSYKDSQERLNQQFERAENYLSLAGLVVLVLGGIGISNVVRVLLEQKRRSIAILKCLGATARKVTLAYLAQIIVLSILGGVFGVLLARIALYFVQINFADMLPDNMSYGLGLGAIAQGLTLGVLVALLFSALPLLGIRHIKPNMLLRESAGVEVGRRSFDLTKWITGAFVGALLIAVAAWQAGSWRVGGIFLLGLVVTTGALYAVASLLVWLLVRARRAGFASKSFAVRHAIGSLGRPGNQTRIVIMATGLGVFLVIAVQLLQSNLVRELDLTSNPNTPNMFLIDVQPNQVEGVRELTRSMTNTEAQLVPTVRARITKVDGSDKIEAGEQQRERGRIGREYVVTYRPNLDTNEKIVDGKFWDATPNQTGEAEISIEKGLLGLAGMQVGSRVTFDILGRAMTARVTSVRDVDWRNSRTGFMIVFRPGALEAAPQTFIGAIDAPDDAAARAKFTRALVDRFPNVAAIDVGEILRNISRIVGNITLAVSFVGAFIFLSGVLILIGSIAMTKFQRIYESAVLRTLGAEQRTLVLVMLIEYGLQGLVAGLTGALAAIGLSYAVARYVLEIGWTWMPLIVFAGIAGAIALVMIVGIAASFDVLRRKPLGILRVG